MTSKQPYRVKTISEFHSLKGLPQPKHPLISVINYADIKCTPEIEARNWIFDFYNIAIKRGVDARLKYGQQNYDFDEGVMFFLSPNQVFGVLPSNNNDTNRSGWMLLIHPDFLWDTSLAKNIKQYEYFDYYVNEALFLSNKEEVILKNIVKNVEQECNENIDNFSQSIIISQIETLLNYSERFYQRQFITRKKINVQVLTQLEAILNRYFSIENLNKNGLPTVQFVAEALNVSPNYLNALLKSLTGQTTQQHLHNKLINKAKEILSTTTLSISEIAYDLGFEHSQSFSKLFKIKTNLSPLEFRQSFN
jgi:AraC-like DNA-binding protein